MDAVVGTGQAASTALTRVAERAPYLACENVVKRFGAFTALSGVSLGVMEGEFVAFLGPSGCGKTTLLRAIAGLDPQDEGRIVQGGRDISKLPPSERDFGIVFQSYALFPNLTIAENVGYGLVSRRMDRAAIGKRVAELLELVGLADQAAKYPAQLSGGQQQRVALARALAPSPGLLLLDEPLSALDAIVRHHLRAEIRGLQQRLGVTTIMVTHDQEEALSVADRIVVMSKGKIEQEGTADEIYDRPASLFVATFVGRMNRIPGTVLPGGAVETELGTFSVASEFAPGSAVVLCLRPEDLAIATPVEMTNRIETKLQTVEFVGSFYRLHLAARNGLAMSAEVPSAMLRGASLLPGATIPFVLRRDRLKLLPPGAAA